jgi:serine/threonine-protein kinase
MSHARSTTLTWVRGVRAAEGRRRDGAARPIPAWPTRLGRYHLIARLGRGGEAEVWKAVQVEPVVELVALKILDRGADPRRLARLRREARRGALLADPALLPAYEFGVDRGIAYLAMPWVDGFTLGDVLDQRRRVDSGAPPPLVQRLALLPEPHYLREVVGALARVARALQAAHAARVVHRDVKPRNILLDRHDPGRIFLIDFGLGRDLDVATPPQLRAREGPLGYMAPRGAAGAPGRRGALRRLRPGGDPLRVGDVAVAVGAPR